MTDMNVVKEVTINYLGQDLILRLLSDGYSCQIQAEHNGNTMFDCRYNPHASVAEKFFLAKAEYLEADVHQPKRLVQFAYELGYDARDAEEFKE